MEIEIISEAKGRRRQPKRAIPSSSATEFQPPQRRTRSRAKEENKAIRAPLTTIGTPPSDSASAITTESTSLADSTPYTTLPNTLTTRLTGLTKPQLALLHRKKAQLQDPSQPSLDLVTATAVEATLVFAQEEAGTAVCISPAGLLLTCSHCVAESPEELAETENKWLLFASGQVVQTKCISWDPKRDLALLQIVAAQPLLVNGTTFPSISPAEHPPAPGAPLLCIGHPGSEDLEVSRPGVKTGYDVLHISTGHLRGYAKGQDLQDNSEIGALKHDCWTYWGHSGAPLVERTTGRLVGLHSSWDDETGMRRGVPLEASSRIDGLRLRKYLRK
ncbi:trypsin-like serine protease [Lepidopterella palustris CBS 459.81]|uniref:Trypsin-like serine protease n=1 Tax=Lepidopterella palustris CBS 459.81 TaxID=1314670 RepID=A0A8E2EK98_9PEZI|nr:trypsin-like serine protease [Lepidopterella palustris CBS 459.81]